MKKKTANTLSTILWAVLAVVLLWLSLRSVDWKQFADALVQCKWPWVVLGMALGLVVFVLRALRWRMQIRPLDEAVSNMNCFNAYNICMAVNLALPRVGEVVRCGYVVKHSEKGEDGHKKLNMEKALGTMVVDRLWDIASIVIIAVLVAVFLWDRAAGFFTGDLSSAVAGKLNTVYIALGTLVLLAVFVFIAWKMRKKAGFWSKLWGIIEGTKDGLLSCLHMRRGWLFIVYTVLIWVLYWLMCYCCLRALDSMPEFASLGLGDAFFLMFAGSVSSIIPVPGGFGAYHAVVAGSLTALCGVPFGVAMIFATISHESQAILNAVAGGISYIWESFFSK